MTDFPWWGIPVMFFVGFAGAILLPAIAERIRGKR